MPSNNTVILNWPLPFWGFSRPMRHNPWNDRTEQQQQLLRIPASWRPTSQLFTRLVQLRSWTWDYWWIDFNSMSGQSGSWTGKCANHWAVLSSRLMNNPQSQLILVQFSMEVHILLHCGQMHPFFILPLLLSLFVHVHVPLSLPNLHFGEQGWCSGERPLTSHQYGPGSIHCPGILHVYVLSLLSTGSLLALRGFSPGSLVFPSPLKNQHCQIPIRSKKHWHLLNEYRG